MLVRDYEERSPYDIGKPPDETGYYLTVSYLDGGEIMYTKDPYLHRTHVSWLVAESMSSPVDALQAVPRFSARGSSLIGADRTTPFPSARSSRGGVRTSPPARIARMSVHGDSGATTLDDRHQ